MYVPLWVALAGGFFTMTGSVVAGYFLFRGKIAELTVTEKTNAVTEEANLRDDQRELINTLKANTASYQDLLAKYAEAITGEAKTQAKLAAIEAELGRLRAEFIAMQADRDKLLQLAAKVPLLEDQIKDRDKTIKQQIALLKTQVTQIGDLHDKLEIANVMLEAATRGQERMEGAVSMSAVIEKANRDCPEAEAGSV